MRIVQFLNQYSFLLIILFFLLGSTAAAAAWFPSLVGLLIVLAVSVGLVAVASVFQYREPEIPAGKGPDALIGNGLPILVAIYSNF